MTTVRTWLLVALGCISGTLVFGQASVSTRAELLAPKTTLPIVFSSGINAASVHDGQKFVAKTTQEVLLKNGAVVRPGASVVGHVVAAKAFVLDKTPYANQEESVLTIQFDALLVAGERIPLRVSVRAMADPITSWNAPAPAASDMDPTGTREQIGGDQVTPSRREVLSAEGDVVGYQRHGGVAAHLIASVGNAPTPCDSSSTEEPMGLFSASACGLYGFVGQKALVTGTASNPSILSLASTRFSPQIWRQSTALLEVVATEHTQMVR
ncbi:hypothetical protein [Terriglobus saanensis]|nr:hypothetical protein [Terriglobus saanensis]